MFSLKDKYILGYLSSIWLYLVYRANHINSIYGEYDYILLTIILFGGWFLLFSYRTFVMTRKYLSNYYYECKLEYKPYYNKGLVEKIFVRVKGENDWRELDYILTIPKKSHIDEYNSFVVRNDTVRKLLTTMNQTTIDNFKLKEYELMKTEYKSIKWLMFSLLVLIYFIGALCIYGNSTIY